MSLLTSMNAKDLILSTCAVVGAVLGFFNLTRSYLADSERLRVAYLPGGSDQYPGVEVINFSPFPITITEIGAAHRGGQSAIEALYAPSAGDSRLPKRIEPRTSHLFRISLHETIAAQVHAWRFVYVYTALGSVFTSEPRLLRWRRRVMEVLHLPGKVPQ